MSIENREDLITAANKVMQELQQFEVIELTSDNFSDCINTLNKGIALWMRLRDRISEIDQEIAALKGEKVD